MNLKRFAAMVVLMALAGGQVLAVEPAKAKLTPAFYVATSVWVAGSFADLRATELALEQPGVRELNPLYGSHPSDARLYVGGAILASGLWFYARHLWRNGNRRAAITILVAGGLVRGAVAERNHRIGEER